MGIDFFFCFKQWFHPVGGDQMCLIFFFLWLIGGLWACHTKQKLPILAYTMKLSKWSPMAKPWPKLHSVGQKIQYFFSVVKPSTKDTKYIQVGIIKKHLRGDVLLFQDKRQSDARERMNVFFLPGPHSYLFPSSFLLTFSLPLCRRQILNCQGTCEQLFQSGRQPVDPWTKKCTVRSMVLWS